MTKWAVVGGFAAYIALMAGCSLQPEARPARIISPEVGPDRRVTFRVRAPRATEVSIAGEFMKGSQKLTKGPGGVWTTTVGPIAPDIYSYSLTIDGLKTIDPANAEIKTGSMPSTTASLLEVKGDGPAFYDQQDVPHGVVQIVSYQSKSLKTGRRVLVYTPPGYEKSAERYPVLYLLHGANADEMSWVTLGKANLIMDNALAAGKCRPFMVVMPFGYGTVPGSEEEKAQNTKQFGRDLMEDLIPLVDGQYRTLADRDHRALIGLSMGGGEAMNIGLNHSELFSWLCGFSAGLAKPADVQKTYGAIVADPTGKTKMKWIWLGCGTGDQSHMTGTRALSEYLTKNGIKNTLRVTEGAHTWSLWRLYLNEVAPELFR